ncbi:two pore domain potassium channel family protein [Bacillus hwajinpoensis]|uniref:Two pore domain potassium channel family protein n=1 Tax=Guptibacillus hwajinpoensis TaxID=208199 RepID=A0A845F3Z2_9BACL|nr:ion channel [Pseudalkalibacillus hwajinpoensis]MYL65367.1 two pore domain potassium channel family protein [Pseudalkalibacillus hwajinpoensis]
MLLLITCAIILALISVGRSMVALMKRTRVPGSLLSVYKMFLLFLVYLTMIIAFGSMYLCLIILDIPVLQEGQVDLADMTLTPLTRVQSVLYFSAVTLLSVGYGDLTPIGIGRWIAIIEALIGYLMPAAFFVTTIVDYRESSKL